VPEEDNAVPSIGKSVKGKTAQRRTSTTVKDDRK
jgi:hypothetical protein